MIQTCSPSKIPDLTSFLDFLGLLLPTSQGWRRKAGKGLPSEKNLGKAFVAWLGMVAWRPDDPELQLPWQQCGSFSTVSTWLALNKSLQYIFYFKFGGLDCKTLIQSLPLPQ